MELDDIQKGALERGELVYAMNQDLPNFDEGRMPEEWVKAAEFGRCVGFALHWVALRARGRDYHFNARTRIAVGGFGEVPRDQAISKYSGEKFLLRIEKVLGQYQVPVNRALYHETPQTISPGFVAGRTFAGDGIYYFEMRREKGGHAIVVHRTGEIYRLFDANEGQFIFKGIARLTEFLTGYLREMGYQKRYVFATWTAAVTGVPLAPIARPVLPHHRARGVGSPWGRDNELPTPWMQQWQMKGPLRPAANAALR